MKGKIICIDWSIFLNMSANAVLNIGGQMTAGYLAMTMILGNLKKIGVDPWDEVFVCCDHMGSWRKDLAKDFKADREEQREKSKVNPRRSQENFNICILSSILHRLILRNIL